VKSVRLFGSRATGRATPRSDIDLAVEAPDATPREWSDFAEAIEESALIQFVDRVRLERLPPGRLRERIESEGVVIHP
jgi:predicted nucleotidyltransferase